MLNTQIAMLARRRRLLRWPARALVWLVFKRERNVAVDWAMKIKQKALARLQAKRNWERTTTEHTSWAKGYMP